MLSNIVNRKAIAGISVGVAAAIAIAIVAISLSPQSQVAQPLQTQACTPVASANLSSSKVQIVAAENFWGSLVSQLGGEHVQVLSIVSDPNADPHEYESNNADARAIADACLVIVKGSGYDDWALKLVGAGSHPNQKLFNVADLLGKKQGDNPHFWYSPAYVNQTVNQMYAQLVSIDPADSTYYHQQYAHLNQSLGVYNNRISEIRHNFAGTRVASTESIFEYMANTTGLDLVSPPEFMQAVSEGNDPSAQSITQFQQLLQNGNVSMLVYNHQTVTPLTENIKSLATQKGIPAVGVTETIQPTNLSFQDWMNTQLISIQSALNYNKIQQTLE